VNYVNWFEIPVENIDRATKFYSTVMGIKMQTEEMGPAKMAIFPSDTVGSVHGSLVQGPGNTPSDKGSLLYLNGGEDLAEPLSRVEAAGGKILEGKKNIGEHGFVAIFKDTEGNRLAFHSMK